MALLESKSRLPMPEFSGYHAVKKYYKKKLCLYSILSAFETKCSVNCMPLPKFKLYFFNSMSLNGIAQ